jgi:hypothetical protein
MERVRKRQREERLIYTERRWWREKDGERDKELTRERARAREGDERETAARGREKRESVETVRDR